MSGRRRKVDTISTAINKQIKRYNAKIKRIKEQYPELQGLYNETMKVADMKKVVRTQKDLDKLTRSIDKLFKKDNIKPIELSPNVYVNKWAIGEYNKNVKEVNRLKSKELKVLLNTPFKGTPFSFVQMGGVVGNELRPIQKMPEEYTKISDFAKMFKSVQFRSFSSYSKYRNEIYKENFLKSLYQVGNEYIDEYGNIHAIDLKAIISKIPAEKFIDYLRHIGEDLHLILNENYTVLQQRERLTELVELTKGFGIDVI